MNEHSKAYREKTEAATSDFKAQNSNILSFYEIS